MRFGDYLWVEWDLNTSDFFLPSLTVQPLVENAVKHGVGRKEEGATAKIVTCENEECFFVTVSGDGVGFAPEDYEGTGEHIGIANVRARLLATCGGTLTIDGKIGCGTTAMVTIFKEVIVR